MCLLAGLSLSRRQNSKAQCAETVLLQGLGGLMVVYKPTREGLPGAWEALLRFKKAHGFPTHSQEVLTSFHPKESEKEGSIIEIFLNWRNQKLLSFLKHSGSEQFLPLLYEKQAGLRTCK